MAEYIGSRISLISKRDIRYVGTLHEISSENSTVALEQVVSWGTEGRRPGEEVAPTPDKVYEYIVFRGSDVKDLRIEKEPEKQHAQVPDDPAILGNSRPSETPSSIPQNRNQEPLPQQQGQTQLPYSQQQGRGGPPPRFQQPPYPYNYPTPNQRFGPPGQYGFPPQGYPGMPYGPPPGWYPPPGQGFPHPPPGQFAPYNMPSGPSASLQNQQQPPSMTPVAAEPVPGEAPMPSQQAEPVGKPTATVKLPSRSTSPTPPAVADKPAPPNGSKPDVVKALAPPAPAAVAAAAAINKGSTVPKSGRIMPAVPMLSPATKPKVPTNGVAQLNAVNATAAAIAASGSEAPNPVQPPVKSLEDANRDARAAVAAAMAKLPPAPGQKKQLNGESAMDNLTNKVNEMRTNDNSRTSRQAGAAAFAGGNRGGRGGSRGGRPRTDSRTKKIEVPKTDYDFASANAKFNKQDLVKEAIASGSPLGSPVNGSHDASTEVAGGESRRESEQNNPGATTYNKTSSFFDNISSESKDRDDSKKLGGREFRSEEQKKNLETFGQGSVDNNYRGGLRGRGRGRGYRGIRGARGGRGVRARDAVAAES